MATFSGRRYGTFATRQAAERYVSNIKDPAAREKTRRDLGLDEPAPESTYEFLTRMAEGNPVREAKVALLKKAERFQSATSEAEVEGPWPQRIPNGMPTVPADVIKFVQWDLVQEGQKDQGLVGAIQLTLPYPPSVNHYYRSLVRCKKPGSTDLKDYYVQVLISQEGRTYRRLVQQAIQQYGNPKTPTGARLVLFIDIHPKNGAKIDIDNRVKAVQDAITKAGVWADDSLIDKLIVERKQPMPGGLCVVKIVPLMEGRLL